MSYLKCFQIGNLNRPLSGTYRNVLVMFSYSVKSLGNGKQKDLMIYVRSGSKMYKDIPTSSKREK